MLDTVKISKMISILGGPIIVLSIGLSISVAAQYNSKDQEKDRDGNCIAYTCGAFQKINGFGLALSVSGNLIIIVLARFR